MAREWCCLLIGVRLHRTLNVDQRAPPRALRRQLRREVLGIRPAPITPDVFARRRPSLRCEHSSWFSIQRTLSVFWSAAPDRSRKVRAVFAVFHGRPSNPALNRTPYRSRLALRYASRLYLASSNRLDCSQTLPPSSFTVHCETFARRPRHAPRTNGSHSAAALRDGYAFPTRVQPVAGCITIVKNTVRFSICVSPRITHQSTRPLSPWCNLTSQSSRPPTARLNSGVVRQNPPCSRHHCWNLSIANGFKSVHPMGHPMSYTRQGIFPATIFPIRFAVVCQKS